MVLLLQLFCWMAKRISPSTNKTLLTVLPALHSLPWAYDSRPSDYHLNISFFEQPGRHSWRCCWASSLSWMRRPGCRHLSQACRSSPTVLFSSPSLDNHPGRSTAPFAHTAVRICHSHPIETWGIKTNTWISGLFFFNFKCFQVWWTLYNWKSSPRSLFLLGSWYLNSISPEVFLFFHYSVWVLGRNHKNNFYSSPVVKSFASNRSLISLFLHISCLPRDPVWQASFLRTRRFERNMKRQI